MLSSSFAYLQTWTVDVQVLQLLPHLTKLDNDDVEAPQMTAQTTPLGTASTSAAEPIQAMSAAVSVVISILWPAYAIQSPTS